MFVRESKGLNGIRKYQRGTKLSIFFKQCLLMGTTKNMVQIQKGIGIYGRDKKKLP